KSGEVGVDELLRRLLRDADVLGQRERRLPVEQRVVDDLGPSPQLVFVQTRVWTEDVQRRTVVNVLAGAEGLDQRWFVGEVREDTQFNLRVVGRDQHVSRGSNERSPDFTSELGADRDVLQVRVRAAQPTGCGDRLVEAGVDAPGLAIDFLRQRVDVSAL